jgi:hypothetical protein
MSWDLNKIVVWEGKAINSTDASTDATQHESFWDMRSD